MPESYFWNMMSAWIPEEDPSSFNQAMMELGALVCVPLSPDARVARSGLSAKQKNWGWRQASRPFAKDQACRRSGLCCLYWNRIEKILLSTAGRGDLIPGEWGLPWQYFRQIMTRQRKSLRASCREVLGMRFRLIPARRFATAISNNQITGLAFTAKWTSRDQNLRNRRASVG